MTPSSLSLASGLPESLATRAAVTRCAIRSRALRPSVPWHEVVEALGLDGDGDPLFADQLQDARDALADLGYRREGGVWRLTAP